jgi:glycosyltransferase involved in cell wall biosynthesis
VAREGRSILLVAQFSPPSFVVAARRVSGMTRHLAQLGYQVTVLTSQVSGSGPIDGAAKVIRTPDMLASSLNWRRNAATPAGKAAATNRPPSRLESIIVPDVAVVSWLPFALAAARRLTRDSPDCVITTSPPQSAHLAGLPLARSGIPWVAEFRDGWRFEPARHDWPTVAQRALDDRLERLVARRADVLVAVTAPIADDLERRYGRKVELITNGFDPDDVDAVGDGQPAGLLNPDRLSIVHTGSMGFTGATARPLVEALLRIREEAPDVAARLEVVFAGLLSTDEAELLGTRDLAGIVRCVGSLDRPSALRLQRAADLLLVVTEGSRRRSVATGKLFEYLTAGRPILVLGEDTEAARIVAATGRGAATSADDSRAISAAIRRAVEEDWPLLTDGSAVQHYSWDQLAERYAAVVEEAGALAEGEFGR